MNYLYLLLSCFIVLTQTSLTADSPKEFSGKSTLYPIPKEQEIGSTKLPLTQSPIIVLGAKADRVEHFAAKRLQTLIQRKSNITLRIVDETEPSLTNSPLILLGQRSTHQLLDQLCDKHNIPLSNTMPNGFGEELSDGFVLKTIQQKFPVVIIGGSNARGTIYGQESFVDLLSFHQNQFLTPELMIRDWPSVKWRRDAGWISDSRTFYLQETGIEALIRARTNLLGYKIGQGDSYNKELIDQLHSMGFLIDAGVHGAIDKHEHEQELDKLKRKLDLGCDRIYVGFDDAGMGEDPLGLLEKIVELGNQYGIKNDYYSVTTLPYAELPNNNPKIAKVLSVKGFEKAVVIITRPPAKDLFQQSQERKINYQFWHNWPMSFTYSPVLRKGAGYLKVYHAPVPFNHGWFEPSDDTMRLGGSYTPLSTFSLSGTRGTAEILGYAWGMYVWNPGGFSQKQTEEAIFHYLFGESVAAEVSELHTILRKISPLFHKEQGHPTRKKIIYRSPLGLIDTQHKESVIAQTKRAQELYQSIKTAATRSSLVEQQRLHDYFLNPLADSIYVYQKAATLSWPEEAVSEKAITLKLSKILEKNNHQEAQEFLNSLFATIDPQLEKISSELGEFFHIDLYLTKWNKKRHLDFWIEKINNQKAGNTVIYITRTKDGMVSLNANVDTKRFIIFYSTDGSEPRAFTNCYAYQGNPFELNTEGTVKAVLFDTIEGIHGHTFQRQFGYPKKHWSIQVETNKKQRETLIDDDLFTHYWVNNGHYDIWNVAPTENTTSEAHPHAFIIDLGKVTTVGGIGYMPGVRTYRNQQKQANLLGKKSNKPDTFTFLWGAAAQYEVYLSNDAKNWETAIHTGHFTYPKLGVGTRRQKPYNVFMEQMYKRVHFDQNRKARYLKFVVKSIYDKQIPVTSMNEFDVFSN
jgi:hypothetical protein